MPNVHVLLQVNPPFSLAMEGGCSCILHHESTLTSFNIVAHEVRAMKRYREQLQKWGVQFDEPGTLPSQIQMKTNAN